MVVEQRYFETLYTGYGQYFDIEQILFEQKTDQWHLIIFQNPQFGRVMALDGIIQTTERDEFIYHEMMTHVPLLAHGDAKRVLIIGGAGYIGSALVERLLESGHHVRVLDQLVLHSHRIDVLTAGDDQLRCPPDET